jgi:hypothetical protein
MIAHDSAMKTGSIWPNRETTVENYCFSGLYFGIINWKST